MYAKLFRSIYEGTLADHWQALVTFQQMLILATADGHVDMTASAISRTTGIPLEVITAGIAKLEQPEPSSRTDEHEGRRIARLDQHREWGWFVVNHRKYQTLVSKADKREADRQRQAQRRDELRQAATGSDKSQIVAGSSAPSQEVAYRDRDRNKQHSVDTSIQDPRAQPESPPTEMDGEDFLQRNKANHRVLMDAAHRHQQPGISILDKTLRAATNEGVTPAELAAVAELHPGKPSRYLLAAARSALAPPPPVTGNAGKPQPTGSPRAGPSPAKAPEDPLVNELAWLRSQRELGALSGEDYQSLCEAARKKHGKPQDPST